VPAPVDLRAHRPECASLYAPPSRPHPPAVELDDSDALMGLRSLRQQQQQRQRAGTGSEWLCALRAAIDEHERALGPVQPLIGPAAACAAAAGQTRAAAAVRGAVAGAPAREVGRGPEDEEGLSALLESVTSRTSSPSADPARNTGAIRTHAAPAARGRPLHPLQRKAAPDLSEMSASGVDGSRAPESAGANGMQGGSGVDPEDNTSCSSAQASASATAAAGAAEGPWPAEEGRAGKAPKCAVLKSSRKGRKTGVKPMDGDVIIDKSHLETSDSLRAFPTMKAWLIAKGHVELANTQTPDMTHEEKNEYHRLYQHYKNERRKQLDSSTAPPQMHDEGDSAAGHELVPGVPRLTDWLKALGHADLAMTRQRDRTPAQKRLYSNLYYRYAALKKPKVSLSRKCAKYGCTLLSQRVT